jgi:hypothetical protein
LGCRSGSDYLFSARVLGISAPKARFSGDFRRSSQLQSQEFNRFDAPRGIGSTAYRLEAKRPKPRKLCITSLEELQMRKSSILLCLFAMSAAGVSSGALIQTDPNGLAIHARATTATNGIYELQNTGTEINSVVYTPPNPGFSGSLMWAAGGNVGTDLDIDTNLADGLTWYAEYTVQFNTQGTYRVWWAGQRTASPQIVAEGGVVGNNDSIFIGGTNVNHLSTAPWTAHTIGSGGISYRDTTVDWIIDGTNVNTDLTFAIGVREDGPVFDRIAFVRAGSGVTAASLVVVPEPSSVVLAMAAVGLAGFGLRRRGK